MAELGSFGAPAPLEAEVDSFTYFGERFEIRADFGPIPLIEFIREFQHLDDESEEDIVAVYDCSLKLVRLMVCDPDRFIDVAKRNRQAPDSVLDVANGVVAALTARPTSRSTDSSSGPLRTKPSSGPVLPPKVRRKKEQLEAEGRPDLAQVLVQKHLATV